MLKDVVKPPPSTPEDAFAQYIGQMAHSLHPQLRMDFQTQVSQICKHKEYNKFTVQ
jgi:hypothetical protein